MKCTLFHIPLNMGSDLGMRTWHLRVRLFEQPCCRVRRALPSAAHTLSVSLKRDKFAGLVRLARPACGPCRTPSIGHLSEDTILCECDDRPWCKY